MIFSSIPIWSIDVIGSILMILFSFLCMLLVHELRSRDRSDVIWTYLLWVCYGLASFAISRSAGHILKQILLFSGKSAVWSEIQPFSGAINTFTFIFVASVTLFFERIWDIYRQISKDKQSLQSTRDELIYLNQNLEDVVLERTFELASSEHKYRRIFEVSRDMIMVSQTDGTIVDMNPAGYQMLGYDEADQFFKNKLFSELLANAADWQKIRKNIEKSGFFLNMEVKLKNSEGREIRALVSGSFDKGLAGTEDTILFLAKDIEQRRLIEDQIAQADKLASIGQLSAGVAHEVNNPLGIILGYTQLLIRNEKQDTEKLQDLKTIEKHARSCKAIVEDLLNFARTSAPKEDLIRIDKAIDDVLKFVQQHADFDRVEIRKEYDDTVPEIFMDEKKIKQVLMNLLMNARHAVGESGIISLSTEFHSSKNQVVVKIADDGYGIEKKNLSRIFDPFFTTKPTGEGTGLGLSVSYGIVKNHGGNISVDSGAGKGSVFTVELPILAKA